MKNAVKSMVLAILFTGSNPVCSTFYSLFITRLFQGFQEVSGFSLFTAFSILNIILYFIHDLRYKRQRQHERQHELYTLFAVVIGQKPCCIHASYLSCRSLHKSSWCHKSYMAIYPKSKKGPVVCNTTRPKRKEYE